MADRELTGILLVGGASSRFGSPKALARFEGETLAERAWSLLGEVCAETIAVGRSDGLPFLAAACREAAVAQAGPLPCAVARRTLPAFETGERRLSTVLAGLDTAEVVLEERLLANVNTPGDLDTLAP